jgi:N-acetyl-anhydromuramyl-L-alanine amidase AmpD
MAQSPEYPDLKWVPPKSWTDANRSYVQCVVIHMTEGAATATAAEDGAAYDQRRTDQTSTHYFHDSNTTIQCVRTADQAHAARTQGNRRGIQHELCGRGGTIDWNGTYGTGVLQHAAKQVARDCRKWDIPPRKISATQLAGGTKGICGHVDVTNAFPQDGGTHTDPGSRFPWSRFINMVQEYYAPEEDSMAGITKQDITDAVWKASYGGDDNRETAEGRLANVDAAVDQLKADNKALAAKVDAQGLVLTEILTLLKSGTGAVLR